MNNRKNPVDYECPECGTSGYQKIEDMPKKCPNCGKPFVLNLPVKEDQEAQQYSAIQGTLYSELMGAKDQQTIKLILDRARSEFPNPQYSKDFTLHVQLWFKKWFSKDP